MGTLVLTVIRDFLDISLRAWIWGLDIFNRLIGLVLKEINQNPCPTSWDVVISNLDSINANSLELTIREVVSWYLEANFPYRELDSNLAIARVTLSPLSEAISLIEVIVVE